MMIAGIWMIAFILALSVSASEQVNENVGTFMLVVACVCLGITVYSVIWQ
jgi:hypothetical protein